MEHVIKLIAHTWDLSPAHYWHLRLLSSLMLAPLLGVLYVVFFDRRKPNKVPSNPTARKSYGQYS